MHFFFDRVLFKPNMVLRPFICLAQPSGLGALTWPKTNTNPKKNIWAFFVIKNGPGLTQATRVFLETKST